MVVNSVSPTPFALLRRAKHFEYREDDQVLQRFSNFEDPVEALTDECRRVLKSISSANQSTISTTKASTSLGDASWSRFEDIGFGGIGNHEDEDEPDSALGRKRKTPQGMRSAPQSKNTDLGRPTTPSWADFLSSGFVDEQSSPAPAPLLLPPDKILPPLDIDSRRAQSSQPQAPHSDDSALEPGELASINAVDLDDAFWWVWITSLAGEETMTRKSVFGRCALIETSISGGTWLVIEEMVKGAAPEPEVGAYIAEKKSRFTFGKKSKTNKTKPMGKKTSPPKVEPSQRSNQVSPMSKTSIGPDQHARIQAAAVALQEKQRQQEFASEPFQATLRRARQGDAVSTKTNSVFTLQPVIMSEAAPAMKWANSYDKKAVRAAYLGNNFTGKGSATDLSRLGVATNGSITPQPPSVTPKVEKEPAYQAQGYGFPTQEHPQEQAAITNDRRLPALPPATPSEIPRAPEGPPPPVPAPPAPLPVEPVAPPANQASAAAAQIPLPATTPMEPAEKPLPAIEGLALEPSRTVIQAQPNGVTPTSSPESKSGGQKLKKQQGGGLKGFFGKPKKGPVSPAPPPPVDSTAVAAARAAYQGPQMKPNYGGTNSLSRRLSGMGRKKTPPVPTRTVAPMQEDVPLPPPAPLKDNYTSQTSLSRVDSNEQRSADHEFNTFDQGPVDQPAFVPEDSPRPSVVPESPTVSRPSTVEYGAHYPPPIGRGGYEPSVSSEEGAPAPQNRWSQIRKNAAERAGGQSEDQNIGIQNDVSRVSEGKTEDGEESGEESTFYFLL